MVFFKPPPPKAVPLAARAMGPLEPGAKKRDFGKMKASSHKLGGDFKYFYFHPYLGNIPILTNIFQRGWNHQLEWCLTHLNYPTSL